MWIINIRHWLNRQLDGPAVPHLKFKVNKLTELITYITSLESDLLVGDPPLCWRRPGWKPCKTELHLSWTEDEQIYWHCPKCGFEGTLDGWQGLIWDVSVEGNYTVH
ncbi:MAG: hypothetical protein V1706_08545 [Pseudomonadota bacterium]